MALNGVVGLHIIGTAGGSNENAVAFARQLRGKYCTLVNADWKLYAPLLDSGIQVIARHTTPDWQDDDADNHQDGITRAKHDHLVYPDKRIIFSGGNELGFETPERTRDWLLEYIRAAADLGHRVCAYNSHFQSPPPDYWLDKQVPVLDLLKQTGGMVGAHKGANQQKGLTAEGAIREDFSRLLPVINAGVSFVITELVGSVSPDRGWQFLYSTADAALKDMRLWAEWIADHGGHATLYSIYKWASGAGFEYDGSDQKSVDFRAGLIAINQSTPVKEYAPVSTLHYMPRMVCPHLNTQSGKLVGLGDGEAVQCLLTAQGLVEQRKNAQRETFFVRDGYLWRVDDTSELWTPDGLQHGTFTVQYSADPRGKSEAERLAIMGCKWLPDWMEVGQEYTRNCWLAKYDWTDTLLAVDLQVTVIKFLEFHASYTMPNSAIVLPNVAVLLWGGEETYYYAQDCGLVRWLNLRSQAQTYLAQRGVTVLTPAQIPLARPTVAPPPAYPTQPPVVVPPVGVDPELYGPLGPGWVESLPVLSANVRWQPDTSAQDIGDVVVGTQLQVRPKLYPEQGTNDGYKWQSVRIGNLDGWVFDGVKIRPGTPEPWLLELPLPFVSQTDSNADLDVNDCLIAVALMLARLHHVQAFGGRVPLNPTVDELVPFTRLAGAGTTLLNFDDGRALALRLGFVLTYQRPLQNAAIVTQLQRGRAVGCLVDRGVLFPGDPHIAHFVAVYGYSQTRFRFHDPYLGGPARDCHMTTLDAAMKTVPSNAQSHQGFVLDF